MDQKLNQIQLGIDSEYFKKSQAVINGDQALTRSQITNDKSKPQFLNLDNLEAAGNAAGNNEPISSRDNASATHELADAIKDKMDVIKIDSSSSDVNDQSKITENK